MPFDSFVLSGITSELQSTLIGGHVQRIMQPKELEVHLVIRSHGKNYRLMVSADARFARICLTKASPENPQTPPAFCMALRKHLEGSHLMEIKQIGFDRVIRMDFQYSDGTLHSLFVEIMGRHSNLVLVDEGGIIIDSIKRIPHRLSRFREVLPGRHYQVPPGDKKNPLTITKESFVLPEEEEPLKWMQSTFQGMSGWLVQEISMRAEDSDMQIAFDEIFQSAKKKMFTPTILTDETGRPVDYFALKSLQHPAQRQRPASSMNEAVDLVAENLSIQTSLEQSRQSLLTSIKGILKMMETRRSDALKGLAESEKADQYRINGELILANLQTLQKGQNEAEVLNYYDPEGKSIKIPLDPRLSPKENADSYFRRQKKARESRGELEIRAKELDVHIYDLKAAKVTLESLQEVDEIEAFKKDLIAKNFLPKPQALPIKPSKNGTLPRFKHVTTPEGWEILIGETAEANDYLTGKVAAPSDLWFHARAVAGAHVILRTGGKQSDRIPQKVIQEAARLAAINCEARHSSLVAVDYTQKRYVRKSKGSSPGNVNYQREKTIHIELK